jgi:diguanylate cyclase (GGDEF)-like protein
MNLDIKVRLTPVMVFTTLFCLLLGTSLTITGELLTKDTLLNSQTLIIYGVMLSLSISAAIHYALNQHTLFTIASYYLLLHASISLCFFNSPILVSWQTELLCLTLGIMPALLLAFSKALFNELSDFCSHRAVFYALLGLPIIIWLCALLFSPATAALVLTITTLALLAYLSISLWKVRHSDTKGITTYLAYLLFLAMGSFALVWQVFSDSETPSLFTAFLLLSALFTTALLAHFCQWQCNAQENSMLKAQLIELKKCHNELQAKHEQEEETLDNRVQERTLELHIALQELEQANSQLAKLNTLDKLTGLYNRGHFDKKLLSEFRRSKRELTPLSLIVLDIDHFKAINDNYGHSAGDLCIQSVASQLTASLRRSTDLGFRYGGEEYCLILPNTPADGAMALAEQLRQTLAASVVSYQGHDIKFTVSSGVSTYQQQPEITPELLFQYTDNALYQAKKAGRNQCKQAQLNEYTQASDKPSKENNHGK